MKELFLVLKRNHWILLLVLASFALTEAAKDMKVFTVAGAFLFVWAVASNINLTKEITGRVILIVFMFLVYLLLGETGFNVQHFVHHIVPICTLYMLGRALVKKNNDETYYVGLLLTVALCCGLFDIVITAKDISEYGLVNMDIFSYEFQAQERGEEWVASSLRAAELASLISCLILVFISSGNSKIRHLKLFGSILSVMAILCALHFVSRSAIVVAAVVVVIGVFYKMFQGQRNVVWILIGLGVVLALLMQSDLWKLMEYKNETTDLATGNNRVESLTLWAQRVSEHPFGTPDWQNYYRPFAHNFWLDFAKVAGWVPAICLVVFSLLNVRDVIRVNKNKLIPSDVRIMVVAMAVAFILAYSVEPIFDGTKNGVYIYFFFCGIVSAFAEIKRPVALE